jgi:hypothetical protein
MVMHPNMFVWGCYICIKKYGVLIRGVSTTYCDRTKMIHEQLLEKDFIDNYSIRTKHDETRVNA